jgi:hypothetical protein
MRSAIGQRVDIEVLQLRLRRPPPRRIRRSDREAPRAPLGRLAATHAQPDGFAVSPDALDAGGMPGLSGGPRGIDGAGLRIESTRPQVA